MKDNVIKGTIFDIKRFSIHDGDGIRTTMFLKGCPLSCVWCHNPEGISVSPRPVYVQNKCIKCGICCHLSKSDGVEMKDNRIVLRVNENENWNELIEKCPTEALAWDSRQITVWQAIEELMKDESFFKHGGGVTLSGGEPLQQPEFVFALLKGLKEHGVHTAIETALYVSAKTLKDVLPYLDLIYADIKIYEEEEHKKYTGVSNKKIKENLQLLLESEKKNSVIIRTPMIPGITTGKDNIAHISQYISQIYKDVTYEILNFNPLAEAKYHLVDKQYYFRENPERYSKEEMLEFGQIALENGVNNVIIE